MDDLLADFIAETREMLQGCEGAIVSWEAYPDDRAQLDLIFRFVHTVKGNCGFFDLPRLASLSHAAESALADVRAGQRRADRTLVSAVLAIIDRIVSLVEALEAGTELPSDGDDALIAALSDDVRHHAETASATARQSAPATISATSPATGPATGMQAARSIRLPVDLLDRVMSGVSDMVLARNDLARRLRDSRSVAELEGPFERLSTILTDVREAITRMRMHRVDQLFQSIPRLVRDLAGELGKDVQVTFAGGEVELDREVLELIRDPITHVLRNAIDHGIETPAQRTAGGKPAAGHVAIAARHAGNEVVLTLADDGRGIDADAVAAKAVAVGLIDADMAEALSTEQRWNLIFEPGLSTAESISEVSGRGVGMDVVRANVERIGGTIEVSSVPGRRTVFQLKVPLTLSIVPGLVIEAAGQPFAVPQSCILEIVRRRSATLEDARLGDAHLVTIRGERIPYLRLDRVLGLRAAGDGPEELAEVLIVLQIGAQERCALGVTRVTDHEELVIKPLAPAIMRTGYYAGLTLLNDGSPILLLDVRGIAAKHGLACGDASLAAPALAGRQGQSRAEGDAVLLFTGCDGLEYALPFGVVERIVSLDADRVSRTGEGVLAPLEGRLLPVIGLAGTAGSGELRLLHLSDGCAELLLAVAAIGDRVFLPAEEPLVSGGRGERLFLREGRTVRLIDTYSLFADHAPPPSERKTLLCALPDDEWAQRVLAPALRAAGYRVNTPDGPPPDVVIAVDSHVPEQRGGQVLHLRSDGETQMGLPGTFHRYDHAGLLAELDRLAGRSAA